MRNLHIVFCSGFTILYYYQMYIRIPFCPHPFQHFLFSVFLNIVILTCVRWYLIVDLNCSSLMMNEVKHPFVHLVSCVSSLEVFIQVFWYFCIKLLDFIFSCMSSLYVLDINSLLDIRFTSIFSHSVPCLLFCWWFLSLGKDLFSLV